MVGLGRSQMFVLTEEKIHNLDGSWKKEINKVICKFIKNNYLIIR